MPSCEHVQLANPNVAAQDQGCTQCLAQGQRWVALRKCAVCGHVGCCDSSPGQHANQHFQQTGHPVMQPLEAGSWTWCYVHQAYV